MSLSRTEIIEGIRLERFSVRRKFFDALNQRTHIPGVGIVAWPDALLILSVNDWNEAYREAVTNTSKGVDNG